MIKPATPASLLKWRTDRGLSRHAAASLIHSSRQVWGDWERKKPSNQPIKLGYAVALALWAAEKMGAVKVVQE